MNSLFVEITNEHKIFINFMKEKYFLFFEKKENFGFWSQWCSIHLDLLKSLNLENNSLADQSYLEQVGKNFMNKRARMASAFFQGLKTLEKEESLKFIKIYKDILKEHDENFKKLLTEVLNFFSEELIKAQRFRKVSAAYVHSHLSQGG